MLAAEDILHLVGQNAERPGVEFKPPGLLADDYLCATIARAVLAMSNRRDGGHVVVGVSDRGGKLEIIGLSNEHQTTWVYDAFCDKMNSYADPRVDLEWSTTEVDGKRLLVVEVREFERVPIVCKKHFRKCDGTLLLREGAVYVRPRGKPESREVHGYAEMRELLDLAIDKGLRHFLHRAEAAGALRSLGAVPSDAERFDGQLPRIDR